MNFQSLPWHKYFLELLGTFFLTFTLGLALGGGSRIMAGVAGATLATLVYLGRSVSGAHYNPAVSLAMMIHGHLSPKDTGFYALA
ncbi:MAG: aquaporin, partial [Bacteroidota bacterium]